MQNDTPGAHMLPHVLRQAVVRQLQTRFNKHLQKTMHSMLVDSRFQKRGEEAKSATTRSMVVLNSSVVENLPRPLSGNLRRPRKKARRNLSTIHPDTEKLKRRLKQKFAYLRFVKHEKDPRSVAYPTARRSAAQLQGLMLPFSSKVQKKKGSAVRGMAQEQPASRHDKQRGAPQEERCPRCQDSRRPS